MTTAESRRAIVNEWQDNTPSSLRPEKVKQVEDLKNGQLAARWPAIRTVDDGRVEWSD